MLASAASTASIGSLDSLGSRIPPTYSSFASVTFCAFAFHPRLAFVFHARLFVSFLMVDRKDFAFWPIKSVVPVLLLSLVSPVLWLVAVAL